MRLLNTDSLQLFDFDGDKVPPYAILSHRWEDEEVLFGDIVHRRAASRAGFAKIQKCCARAHSFGIEYVWIDTCCINKSSSAELSEAINSMYSWYQGATICYAYLSDVDKSKDDIKLQMSQSVWFTRGWTLQELLAPKDLTFLDQKWSPIGTKSELSNVITRITGISTVALRDPKIASVAMKFSWASRRQTSRAEDMAYSLMGLFDVNMPLLYGEGSRAFQRLQLEILQRMDDDSIFAWDLNRDGALKDLQTGQGNLRWPQEGSLVAPSPSHFIGCGNVQNLVYFERQPYTVTNRGLRIRAHLLKFPGLNFVGSYLIPLNCARITRSGPVLLAIKVSRLSDTDVYLRENCAELDIDAKVISTKDYSNKVSIDITVAEFFDILQSQPSKTIYIPLDHSARYRIPETLSSAPVDWTIASAKARLRRLGIVDEEAAEDIGLASGRQLTEDDADADDGNT